MYKKELEDVINVARIAAIEINKIYNNGFSVDIKEDNSPVTEADKSADLIIRTFLSKKYPNYSLLTEESIDDLSRLDNDFVWIIDPVDGTKEFVDHLPEFTTNIALCYKHEIVLGLVMVPISGEYYYAIKGEGAYYVNGNKKEKIHVSDKLQDLTCLISRYHFTKEEEDIIKRNSHLIKHIKDVGSSLKACLIAKGKAEVTYRMSPNTKEWDTAATQIIVEEAGGVFLEPDETPITYNRKDVYNRNGYIIVNRRENFHK